MAGEEAVLRKWLIINGRYFEELKAMDRQCPWLLFIMVGVKVRTEPGTVGGPHESACPGAALGRVGGEKAAFCRRLPALAPGSVSEGSGGKSEINLNQPK